MYFWSVFFFFSFCLLCLKFFHLQKKIIIEFLNNLFFRFFLSQTFQAATTAIICVASSSDHELDSMIHQQ